jgi:hypothetical protein
VRLAAVLAALALAPAAGAAPPLRILGPYGRGSAQVWILPAAGPQRAIVVFGHGWKAAPPSRAHPFVRQFAPWLRHLVARGDTVVFPRYQLGGDAPGPARVADFRSGLRLAFARLPRSVPVVAAGYSYGATLALTYAADAGTWRLPRPRAVDLVFPAGLVPGVPLAGLPARVPVLVQVGDRDTTAGPPAAAPVWAWLRGHARRRYQVVRSRGAFVADHAAVKLATPAARQAFWSPLDALVDGSR